MTSLPLIYARDRSPVSVVIRAAQWWAPWSHVGVLDEARAQVIEARMLQGVIVTPLPRLTNDLALPVVSTADPIGAGDGTTALSETIRTSFLQ